jgi:UPF0716 family protein affecting phage T7 exclusion
VSLRARLIVFGYPLLEIATAYLVALAIGWGWMLLLLLVAVPIGFAVMRNAADSANPLTFVGGALIAVPGFWTDLAGLALLVPPIQRLVRARAGSWVDSRVSTVRMPGVRYTGTYSGEVIEGTVIKRDDTPPSSTT